MPLPLPFHPSSLTAIDVDDAATVIRCTKYFKNTKFAWTNLTNAEYLAVIGNVKRIIAAGAVDLPGLKDFFDNLEINRQHYDNKECQKQLLQNSLLLVCNYSYDDLRQLVDPNDESFLTFQSQKGATVHMAQNSNDQNKVTCELIGMGGQELTSSDLNYEGRNILYKHSNGSILFLCRVDVLSAYVILHEEWTFMFKHKGRFVKGGKSIGCRVWTRGRPNYTYPKRNYEHDKREISRVCSYNHEINGTLEVRV